MINIKSFFRKKYVKIFVIIILSVSLFNGLLKISQNKIDSIDNENIYVIIKKDKLDKISNEYIISKENVTDEILNENFIEGINKEDVYKVKLNRISIYEKYIKDYILFNKDKYYDDTLKSISFFNIITNVLSAISIILLGFVIYSILHYEKENILLLKMLGFNKVRVFLIYAINLILMLLPTIAFYIIIYCLL